MTTEEKLQHFLDFCMEDAQSRSTRMLDEYMAAMDQTFEEHKKTASARAKAQIQMETEKMERNFNKDLSIEQIKIKRTLSQKQEELKDMLFVELKDMLEHFMDTPEYSTLLVKQIQAAKEVAGKEEMIIYMDPADEEKIGNISMRTSTSIKASEYSFMGGIRAVVPSKSILIDNSFETKLDEARHNFKFRLEGGKTNG